MRIEDEFEYQIRKHLDERTAWHRNVQVDTVCGAIPLAFLAEGPGGRVGFRFGGGRYSEWEDALLLGAGAADTVVTVSPEDLRRELEDCLYLIGRGAPWMLSERGRAVIERQASRDARRSEAVDTDFQSVTYTSRREEGQEDQADPELLRVTIRRGGNPFRTTVYQYMTATAMMEGRCSVEEMHRRWEAAMAARQQRRIERPNQGSSLEDR